MVKDMSNTSD